MQTTESQQKGAPKATVINSGKTTLNPLQRKVIDEEDDALQTNPLQLKKTANNPLQLQAGETSTPQPKENNTGLPDILKSGVEALSGFSMDDVNVHYNSNKPAQLQALAYAQGTDIHIAPGQEQHLPHEAWHVVQQKQGRVQPTMQMKQGVAVNDDDGLEKEADMMGEKALQFRTLGPSKTQSGGSIDKSVVQRVKTLYRGYTLARAEDAVKNRGSLDPVGKGEFGRGLYFWDNDLAAALMTCIFYYGNKKWAVIKVEIPDDVYDEYISNNRNPKSKGELSFPAKQDEQGITEGWYADFPEMQKPSVAFDDLVGQPQHRDMFVEEFRVANQNPQAQGISGENDNKEWGYGAIKGQSAADYDNKQLIQIKFESSSIGLFKDRRVIITIAAQGPPIPNHQNYKMTDKDNNKNNLAKINGVVIQEKKKNSAGTGSLHAKVIQRHGEFKSLGSEKQTIIEELSNKHYYKNSQEFEKLLGRYAAIHPISKRTSQFLVDRVYELAQQKIGNEFGEFSKIFGTENPGNTGSVGTDLEAILSVFEQGNFREQMTLIYNSYVNRQLSPLISNAIWGNPAPNQLFQRPESLNRDRAERKEINDPERTRTSQQPEDIQYPPLSPREQSFSVIENKLMWVPGLKRVYFEKTSNYLKEADNMKVLAGAGLSGSAYAVIEIAMILGITNLYDARLASLGWMLTSEDHTFYEIMKAAAEFGLEYIEGPFGYRYILPLSEDELQGSVAALLEDNKFPDYYLSEEFKDEKAAELK